MNFLQIAARLCLAFLLSAAHAAESASSDNLRAAPGTPTSKQRDLVSATNDGNTQSMIDVLVHIELDSYASETGWQILDESSGEVLAEDPTGTFNMSESAVESRVVSIPSDVPLKFVLLDAFGDGLWGRAFVYLGNEADNNKVLAYYEYGSETSFSYSYEITFVANQEGVLPNVFPTQAPSSPSSAPTNTPTAPTMSPAPSGGLVPVLIEVRTDSYPNETGWRVSSIKGDILEGVSPGDGSYVDSFQTYQTSLSLNGNGEYTLTLLDAYGDGLYSNVTVYLGDEADSDKILAYYDGSYMFFSSELDISFVVSEDAILLNVFPTQAPSIPTVSPTAPPTAAPSSPSPTAPTISPSPTRTMTDVLVYIELDSYASETGWQILDESSGDVLAEDPTGTFNVSESTVVSRQVSIPSDVPLKFVLLDAFGDGLWGRAFVYLGNEADNNKVLAYYEFGSETSFSYSYEITFVANQEGVLPNVFPTQAPSSPSSAPTNTPTAPTVSPAPSGGLVPVLIEVITDSYPNETGWRVSSLKGDILEGVSPGDGSYVESYHTYQTSLSLNGNVEYTLTLLDAYGDGLYSNVTVYLGDEADGDKILASYDGSYMYFSSELDISFVVSEDAAHFDQQRV